jgi:signal transduction histidine kinase
VIGRVTFREIFLGNHIIASRSEYKRLMLTAYMSVTCVLVALFYAVIDFVNQVFYSFPAYLVLFLIPLFTLILLRLQHYKTAKVILIIAANLVVFWAALNDPFETGVYLFFIPAGVGSFAILAVEDYKTGFALATFTTFLFLVAYFGDLHPINAQRPTDEYIKLSFILNYFISLTISVLAVYFLMNLNKHSENELIKKEMLATEKNAELLKVNAELDRFVYSVSHDLRSPLSSILGLTNLAQKTTDPKELNEILEMIRGRINAQDNFIRDIIDYARNTRTDISIEPVNLHQVANEVIGSLRYNHNADKITFINNVSQGVTLNLDAIRISVILNNLVANAIKYHDLRKSRPFVEIGFSNEKKELFVKDNGIGIPDQHIGKIFNMFYRGSDRSSGSGLGLYITKEAVTKIGGSIEVRSVYGEGSTFIVQLNHKI